MFFLHPVLATPATCSNHPHRAKPCILYRFLTHSEHKTKLSSPTLQAICSSTKHHHKPPREPECCCNQVSAAKPSTIARITPLSRENPQFGPKISTAYRLINKQQAQQRLFSKATFLGRRPRGSHQARSTERRVSCFGYNPCEQLFHRHPP